MESHPPPPSVKTLLVLHERGESHLVYRDFTNSLFSSSVILHQPASVSFWMVVVSVNPWWSWTLTTGSETQKFAFEWGACVAQCSLRTTDIWWLKTQLSLVTESIFLFSWDTNRTGIFWVFHKDSLASGSLLRLFHRHFVLIAVTHKGGPAHLECEGCRHQMQVLSSHPSCHWLYPYCETRLQGADCWLEVEVRIRGTLGLLGKGLCFPAPSAAERRAKVNTALPVFRVENS